MSDQPPVMAIVADELESRCRPSGDFHLLICPTLATPDQDGNFHDFGRSLPIWGDLHFPKVRRAVCCLGICHLQISFSYLTFLLFVFLHAIESSWTGAPSRDGEMWVLGGFWGLGFRPIWRRPRMYAWILPETNNIQNLRRAFTSAEAFCISASRIWTRQGDSMAGSGISCKPHQKPLGKSK